MIKNFKILFTLIFFLNHAFLCKAAAIASDVIIIKAKQVKLGHPTPPSIIKKSFAKKYKSTHVSERNLLGGVSSYEQLNRPEIAFIIISPSAYFTDFYNTTELVFIRNNSPPSNT